MSRPLAIWLLGLFACSLVGCGGTSATDPGGKNSIASQSDILLSGTTAGTVPFVATAKFSGNSLSHLKSAQFIVKPKANALSAAVNVTWLASALSQHGYLLGSSLSLPVFGLYAGYDNPTSIALAFDDGSSQSFQATITAPPYTDPNGILTKPVINKARSVGDGLDFSYFVMKSAIGSPVVVDTDGEVRWVIPTFEVSISSIIYNGRFLVGDDFSTQTMALNWDGTSTALPVDLSKAPLLNYTHNIDPSPNGIFAEFDGSNSDGKSMGDILVEINPATSGPPLQVLDMGTIISSYMKSHGDDPSQFVRPGTDWFHINASTYDPSDQSIIVSSRENS